MRTPPQKKNGGGRGGFAGPVRSGSSRNAVTAPELPHPGKLGMSTNPASLLRRLQTGDDHEARERFAERYAPLLTFGACRRHAQAEDAAPLTARRTPS